MDDLAERLKLEAQVHAGEARAANSTIYEIYQCVTKGKGEPGNWNGAVPVVAEIERLRAIEKAAWAYFNHAVQDEAADRECCTDDEQHRLAWELRDALGFPA